MELISTYQEMIKVHGWNGTAATLGMTKSALEARVYEVKGSGMRVDTALLLQTYAGTTHFAEAIAVASGGTFVKLPADLSDGNEILSQKFHTLYAKLGTFSTVFSEATANDVIDSKEAADLTAIAMAMQQTIAELLALTFRIYCPGGVSSARGAQ